MVWSWRLENADGREVEVTGVATETFPTRSDAESWLGEHWRTLSEEGVGRVVLLDADREVYPMSLEEGA